MPELIQCPCPCLACQDNECESGCLNQCCIDALCRDPDCGVRAAQVDGDTAPRC